jgi:acyl transferase domain-containing protein
MSEAPDLTGSEVAIIGLAARAPGASSLDAFWENLRQGVESVRRFTREELAAAGEDPALVSNPDYVAARPFLADIDQFDAEFFGLSPQDAAITDPQHRMFLECGWEALEYAGHDPSRFAGQVGVFATCGMNSYMMYHLVTNPRLMRTVGEWLIRHTGNDMSFLATSVSYRLDLKGPSLNVQCACSSALVAVHLAAQSLLAGECDMALAGGSVIALPQDRGYLYQEGEILARDGHCRPFDANATGTLFGSGAGVVVLRRLVDAVADGDQVLAVIKGSAANNDGSMKVGFLAPSVEGQSRVITEALAVSGVDASTISYVEAHGTGTIVGDPIEVTALTEAYRRHTQKAGFCRIGSLKSNIGHLGEAAGALGLIKTVLSLQHGELPPSLNFEAPNPRVDFAASPFVVNDRLHEWTSTGAPRRAGVTALGAGGTNCHVILEEAPAARTAQPPRRPEQLLVLSAKTPTALERMRANLAATLTRADAPALADTAYTLRVGRKPMPCRWTAVAASNEEAASVLLSPSTAAAVSVAAARPSVVFLFAGGGVQYPKMGRDLYDAEPVFRTHVDRCLDILRNRHRIDLAPWLFPIPAREDEAAQHLSRSTPSILSIFTIEYALCQLWMSWGVTPAAMSGHSLGEYVAACVAGVFSLEDALAIVKARGDIFERIPAGAMLSVMLPESDVARRLSGRLALAAVNAPSSCVVSGPVDEVAAFAHELQAAGVETQAVHIAVAAHSPMLDPFLEEFRRTVASARLSAPTIPFVSNLTGRWISAADATDAGYWVRHLRQTVRFADGLATILETPDRLLLEAGPGRALTSLARQQPRQPLGVVTSLRHPSERATDGRTILAAAGRLWSLGVNVDWSALENAADRRRVPLPAYPFERQRHWIDAPATAQPRPVQSAPLTTAADARSDVGDWFYVPGWTAAPLGASDAESPGDVLIFADAAGVAAAAVARLPPEPHRTVHIIDQGDGYRQVEPTRFTARLASSEDAQAVFDALGDRAGSVTHIVYGWTLDPAAATDDVAVGLERHFFGPLSLAQVLARRDPDRSVRVVFLVQGLGQVAGETGVDVAAACVLGPALVMPRELPNVATQVIDVGPARGGPQADLRSSRIAAELLHRAGASIVALRRHTRWTPTLAQLPLPRDVDAPLRDGGVYVITGGTGGLGLEVASYLARTRHANLVLVSRTALPPRSDWSSWMANHAAGDGTSRKLARLLECEAMGARVLVSVADVTDVDQLAAVRADVLATFGRVDGIFHTAGTLDDAMMPMKTRASALSVLRPKVQGTLAIQAVFGGDALDVIVLFSSISSVLGLQGQADYTAANAFLDALAEASANASTRVVSVNWGPWKDVGLAVSSAAGRSALGAHGTTHPWLDRSERRTDAETVFETTLSRERQWMIGEHVVRGGSAVMPGTAYLELARAAFEEVQPGQALEIDGLVFQAPIVVPDDGSVDLEVVLRPAGGATECIWRAGSEVCASATITALDAVRPTPLDVAAIRSRCRKRVLEPRGLLDQPFMVFGPRWANVERVSLGEAEALVELRLPREFADDVRRLHLHPALMDMATGGAQALIAGFDQRSHFYVPLSYNRVRVFGDVPEAIVSHVRLSPHGGNDLAVFDVTVVDADGNILVEIEGFGMKRIAASTALGTARGDAASAASPLVHDAGSLADEMLRQGMTPREGADALDRVLHSGIRPRVAVSPVDPAAWIGRIEAARDASTPRRLEPESAGLREQAEGFDAVEASIAGMWRDLLGVRPATLEAEFFELGGHSLMAIRLLSRIEKTFQARLPVSAVFESPRLGTLSELVRARMGPSPSQSNGEAPVTAVSREAFRKRVSSLPADFEEEA